MHERKKQQRKPPRGNVQQTVRRLLASLDKAITATKEAERARDELVKLSQDLKK